MLKHRKKGQASGLEVSILVILITLFIAGYVILLPPEDRASLLGTLDDGTTETGEALTGKLLLSESPGTLEAYKTNVQETTLESMHLYTTEETKTDTLSKSLTVSKTLIKDNYKNLLFNIENIDEVKEAKISFMITESKGEMTMKLNGQVIYEGKLTTTDMPIILPKEHLKNSNVLELSVESPGWKLFSSNYYLLKDITLIKELSTKKTKASRTFSLDTTDNEITKAKLSYFINCNIASEGELTITLNNKEVFQDEIFCQYLETREQTLPEEYLNEEGKNTLTFEIDEGDYNIDEIELELRLEKSAFLQYAFEGTSGKATLYMKFPTSTRKRATIYINDKQFSMDTTNTEYTRDITDLVTSGKNSLKIEAQDKFEVDKLEVRAE
ncbi:MAG: hypothetical protein V1914_02650 [archaeon]